MNLRKGKQAPLGMRWGQIYSIGIVYMQSLSRWGIDKHAVTVLGTYMRRLNFEEFRKFLCAKILYLWPRHIKSHTENWLKLLKLFRIFLNIHNLFDFFIKNYKTLQSRAMHHKIRHQILYWTAYVRWLWNVVGRRYHVFYRFYEGWNCVSSVKII